MIALIKEKRDAAIEYGKGVLKTEAEKYAQGDLNTQAGFQVGVEEAIASAFTGGSTQVAKFRNLPRLMERAAQRGAKSVDDVGKWYKPGDLMPEGRVAGHGPGAALRNGPDFELGSSPILWDQRSQRWRDVFTGRYTKGFLFPEGNEMPKGFGKPSTWIEEKLDVSQEVRSIKDGERVYEQMISSSTADDLVGAFEETLKALSKRKGD